VSLTNNDNNTDTAVVPSSSLDDNDTSQALDPFALSNALNSTNTTLNLTALQELGAWESWVNGFGGESIWKRATSQIDALLVSNTDASDIVASPKSGYFQTLIARAGRLLLLERSNSDDSESDSESSNTIAALQESNEDIDSIGGGRQPQQQGLFMEQAQQAIADIQGVSLGEAADLVEKAAGLAANLVQVAERVLRQGYVKNEHQYETDEPLAAAPVSKDSRALFADFQSARHVELSPQLQYAASMGLLAGAIYEQTLPRCHRLGHSLVAEGLSGNVRWMVTDALTNTSAFAEDAEENELILVRTITIRGFDASDEIVDREKILLQITSAKPTAIKSAKGVVVHSGLLEIAREIYPDIKPYIQWTAPNHRIVLNGHSIGGALSLLLLFLLTADMGSEFVRDNVARVYTFGSPPVVGGDGGGGEDKGLLVSDDDDDDACEILNAISIPASMVHGFVQPWDPVVRLFTQFDALYPLVSDLGDDGFTPFASGPPRTLRPIAKRIFEAWEKWPEFRDNYRDAGKLPYRSVGIQHILVPEPTRYLADRFVAVNIQVPPIEAILRISATELMPALAVVFPLDEFEISFVPQAIRSFVHHFYPAYGDPVVEYVAKRLEKEAKRASSKSQFDGLDETKAVEQSVDSFLGGQWLQG
jgi:hypothetical protein